MTLEDWRFVGSVSFAAFMICLIKTAETPDFVERWVFRPLVYLILYAALGMVGYLCLLGLRDLVQFLIRP
jgi:hypothetical protein